MSEIDGGGSGADSPGMRQERSVSGSRSGGSRSSSSRRRRRSTAKRSGLRDALTSAAGERAARIAFLVALVAFLGLSINSFSDNSRMLGNIYMLGPTHGETLYIYGQPRLVRPAADAPWIEAKAPVVINDYPEWGYTSPAGGTVQIRFDPATGRTDRVTCADGQLRILACPAQFGVRIGDFEDRVVYQIGRPNRDVYQGPSKQMVYSDVGVTFTLRELRVRGITLDTSDRSIFEMIPRYLRYIVP